MMLCPRCDKPIPVADINIARDEALCRGCGAITAISSVVGGGTAGPASATAAAPAFVFNPGSPPEGASYRDDGVEVVIAATTRSSAAIALVPFAVIWSAGFLGGIYGSQLASGKFDLVTSLIGVPFLIASVALVSFALFSLRGRVEVRLRQGQGAVFVGVGSLGWKRRFDAARVTTIREDWAGWSCGKKPRRAIVLEGQERVSFGSMLSEARRHFVLEALRQALKLG